MFHKLWSAMGASRLFVDVKQNPIRTPRSVKGSSLCMLKCRRAKITALATTAAPVGTYRRSDGIKNPRNNTSSQIGDMQVVQNMNSAWLLISIGESLSSSRGKSKGDLIATGTPAQALATYCTRGNTVQQRSTASGHLPLSRVGKMPFRNGLYRPTQA
mmetsp:Transcript_10961/g.22826  ORF Transcript_10961/g.22826 Transcript_10961/m.22826 type:complete len:158 (-) Transcript_10961:3032-3505(-)